MEEIWKDIKGYENHYQVSNWGRIKTIKNNKEKIMTPSNDKKYLKIVLSLNNKVKTFRIHRLVAIAFLPNSDENLEVNHKDKNPHNNNVNNLQWCDRDENIRHKNAYKYKIDFTEYIKALIKI